MKELNNFQKACDQIQQVQDERAASFLMLSKTVGGACCTEYQPEVDLEINARIEQLKYEKDILRENLKSLVKMHKNFQKGDATYENAYYCFYKGQYETWQKAKDVIEQTK